jgi:hypothetical protein
MADANTGRFAESYAALEKMRGMMETMKKNQSYRGVEGLKERMAARAKHTSWRQMKGIELAMHEINHPGNKPFMIGLAYVVNCFDFWIENHSWLRWSWFLFSIWKCRRRQNIYFSLTFYQFLSLFFPLHPHGRYMVVITFILLVTFQNHDVGLHVRLFPRPQVRRNEKTVQVLPALHCQARRPRGRPPPLK